MNSDRLPKISLEEAYEHRDDAARILASEDELAASAAGGGVTPEYYRPIHEKLAEFDEVRLGSMDAAGIEHQVLSLTAPGVQIITDGARATAEARRQNDFLAEQIARYPDRYSGFAAVALQEPGNAVKELRRAVTELGFKGVLINGYTNDGDPEHGRYLDAPAYHPFWEALCELDVPLYLHPRPALPGGLALYQDHPEMKGATWGFGTETAAHTVRMLLGGHFDRFPTAKLILGHMGEALPALLWRTQNMFDLNPFDKKIKKTLPEYFADNIWITTSGNFSDHALINAMLTVGADHILFSVDYPYSENATAAEWIEKTPISELDRRKIAHGNARELFAL
ncbi:amidohydrolase family protein [Streptomyces canus]|uniref:amidohydrolase family protein n=1 Tax=Streptomyces canus TaxID=58343 RepID=UPI0022568625|nr:amidohydrolase family protein [Streptomyces canus]MCX4854386.1 amidohydrolase family protein [Streptomyces canus]WSW40170.1 amidohydrolase family protein [Streptomyces canus]